MQQNPYANLPEKSYWRTGVSNANKPVPQNIYTKKWAITKDEKIATAGSCFAQHIGRRLHSNGFSILDAEPAPKNLPENRHMDYGYSIYSGRYGNIYTVRQMLQLAKEAFGVIPMSEQVWAKGDRFVDALRPTIEPQGLPDPETVIKHRKYHLAKVRQLLTEMDLFIFTMGLTETWIDRETNRVLPVCPGTVAGEFDDSRYKFRNFSFPETRKHFVALRNLLLSVRGDRPLKFLLTVSPVPLTATAAGNHVQVSTVYSKSVLRAVAGDLADSHEDIDYFPSYEIVTSPWSGQCFYEANMRSVSAEGVDNAMQTFMASHGGETQAFTQPEQTIEEEDRSMLIKCDEELLDAFAGGKR